MSPNETVMTLMRAFDERDWKGIAALLDDEFEFHDPVEGRTFRSPEEFVDWLKEGMEAFPDARAEDVRLVTEGRTVVSTLVERATHDGPLTDLEGNTIAPSGAEIEWPLCNVWEFGASGRISGGQTYYDRLAPLEQIQAATARKERDV